MAIDHNHLNLHANHLWADYHNHALPSGTVAYESVLRQCQLDGSLLSLQRIDAMLTHLRQELIKTFTQAQKSVNTADMQRRLLADERFVSLLLIIGHYAGQVLAEQWQHPPTWYGQHQLMTQVGQLNNAQKAMAQDWVHALAVQYADGTDARLAKITVATIKQPEMFFVLEPIINRLFGSFDNVIRSIQTDMRVPSGLYQAIQQRLPQQRLPQQHLPQQHLPQQHLPQQHLPQQRLPQKSPPQTASTMTNQANAQQPPTNSQTPATFQDSVQVLSQNLTQSSAQGSVKHSVSQSIPTAKVGMASVKSIVASHGIFAELMQDIMTMPVQQNVGNLAYQKVSQFFVRLDKAYPTLDDAKQAVLSKLTQKQQDGLNQAKSALKKLAEQGNSDAMLHLAVYLMQGKWFDDNQQQGLMLIQTAANAQDPRAMRMMSKLYYQGLGVNVDVNMGRHWLNLAADKGHEEAKNLIKQMDLAQMMIAERQEEIKSDDRLIKLMAAVAVVAILIVMIV